MNLMNKMEIANRLKNNIIFNSVKLCIYHKKCTDFSNVSQPSEYCVIHI